MRTKPIICIILLSTGFADLGLCGECTPLPSGIVSWWPGDGNPDDRVGTNAGKLVNGASYAPGLVGQGFSFDDRKSAYVAVPDSPSLNIGLSDFSMDAWIRTSSRKDIGTIQDKRGSRSAGYHFYVRNGGIGPAVQFSDGVNVVTEGADVFLADGLFHHVAVTVRRDKPDGIRLFVDGKLAATADPTPVTGEINSDAPLLIGGHLYDSWRSFAGVVDEFDLFKRALSDAEIHEIYASGAAGKCIPDAFATFLPRAEFTLGPKPNDDSYWVRGWLKLADTSNGIDPLTETVTIKVGPFSHTLPTGSFKQEGSSYLFKGPVGSSMLDIRITPSTKPGGYSFKSCLKNGSLGTTTMEPQVELTIGDDHGEATLDIGYAKFGKGLDGQKWVFPPAQ